jgi:hypothetical protein
MVARTECEEGNRGRKGKKKKVLDLGCQLLFDHLFCRVYLRTALVLENVDISWL